MEYEDFDEADAALMAFFAEEEGRASSGSSELDHYKFIQGKDLTALYESGMMKSVHMQVQENAKIPNLSMTIDRTNHTTGSSSTRTWSPPTTEKFLQSSQRESAALNYSVAGELAKATSAATPLFASNSNASSLLDNNHQASCFPTTKPISTSMENINNNKDAIFDANNNFIQEKTLPVQQQQPQQHVTTPAAPAPVSTTIISTAQQSQYLVPTSDHQQQHQTHLTYPYFNSASGFSPYSFVPVMILPTGSGMQTTASTQSHTMPSITYVAVPNNAQQQHPFSNPMFQQAATATTAQHHPDTTQHSLFSTSSMQQITTSPPKQQQQHAIVSQLTQEESPSTVAQSPSWVTTLATTPTSFPSSAASGSLERVNPEVVTKHASTSNTASTSTPFRSDSNVTTRHNQFGFGNNHIVPSVPIPPYVQQQVLRHHQNISTTTGATAVPPNSPSIVGTPNDNTNTIETANNTVAYERKKQKAKTSRVLLNDSIDRLSVAIQVAKTQSRKRISEEFQKNTNKTMLVCEEIANSAVKHDRPSFIGIAATMVQALNDQCEALLEEVRTLKKEKQNLPEEAVSCPEACALAAAAAAAVGTSADFMIEESTTSSSLLLSPQQKKRMRISSSEDVQLLRRAEERNDGDSLGCSFSSLLPHEPVRMLLALFLDPISLGRCRTVCQSWHAMEELTSDVTWHNLCIRRFGKEQIQSWMSSMQEPRTKMQLYRDMSVANVPPFCFDVANYSGNPTTNNVKLGDAKCDGVSAWASMMSRSNGETLRSVKQPGEVFSAIPVVELRIVVQNTGIQSTVSIPADQSVTVDVSTRRRLEELAEITSDERLTKQILYSSSPKQEEGEEEMYRLSLFDSVVLVVYIHAKGCCTTSKFLQKANFTKLLVQANSKTWAVVMPFSNTTSDSKNSNEPSTTTTLSIQKKRGVEKI